VGCLKVAQIYTGFPLGRTHVFNDRETLERVTQAIIEGGERTGIDDESDDYERYGLYFSSAIGYIIRTDRSKTPLFYGEIKIVKTTGEYHVIPRTSPEKKLRAFRSSTYSPPLLGGETLM